MLDSNLLTDQLADQIAELCLPDYQLRKSILEFIREELAEKPLPNKELFDALFKSLVPHERRFSRMLKKIWEEQRLIVIANLRKLRKAYLGKAGEEDTVSSVLYPKNEFVRKWQDKAKTEIEITMKASADRVIDVHEFGMAFDVQNPEVQKWLKEYVPVFSKNLEAVSTDKLRRELLEGLKAGEGVPELMKRVNGTYANWHKFRSESIARTEALRASNQGAIEAYKQSGVVKKKVWITHFSSATCDWCKKMHNKVISLEKNFFNKGDAFTILVDGKKRTMKLDYSDTPCPPVHTRCRCTVAAVID